MRRAILALISLYPRAWRERYEDEYCALLDQMSPSWRILFDVLKGAMKTRLKVWTAVNTVAAFAVIGAAVAAAYSWTAPQRFVSTAVIRKTGRGRPEQLVALIQKDDTPGLLAQFLQEEDLYGARPSHPAFRRAIEDIMHRGIAIRPLDPDTIAVSFTANSAGQAQQAARRVSTAFVDFKVGQIIDPPNLPVSAQNPRRVLMIAIGLAAGIGAGAVFSLFKGLRLWKLAIVLGGAGAVLFGAASYLIPRQYSSMAVICYDAPNGINEIGRSISRVKADASLRAMIEAFRLYPGDSRAVQKMREHLRMEQHPNAKIVMVRFDYLDPYVAQKITGEAVSRFLEDNLREHLPPARSISQDELRRARGTTLELVDPASFPFDPSFPNRTTMTVYGLALGLVIATLIGITTRRQIPA